LISLPFEKEFFMPEHKPVVAITMGDPAGCGPEVLAMAAAEKHLSVWPVCVGDCETMQRAIQIVDSDVTAVPVERVEDIDFVPGQLPVIDLKNVDLDKLEWGKIQQAAGQAAYEYITHAIDLAMAGQVDAVVTSAINKEALHLAGHKFDGHTEIFAAHTGAADVTMMLASGHFRVTHVSTHVSLRRALELCQTERILKVIQLTQAGLRNMGIENPHLAVAGLNPHSGEGGAFGREEIEIIQPAIDLARSEGIDIVPYPVPPDTVFVKMLENKQFDAVIAQYHDQGHIAAKIVDFWGGVNITLGLPIIRTSVDHGTAFDIAGQGKANPQSMINAIKYAHAMIGHSAHEEDGKS
jgi:4-hydroxythreonine-4-phosphate dehydrogenase